MTLEEMEKKLKILEQKVRIVEDIEEIRKLHYRYVNFLSVAKWDEVMECFSEDSMFVYGEGETARGKAEIEKLFKDFFSQGHVGRDCNIVVHPMITVDGDEATGTWTMYQIFSYRRTGQLLFLVRGIYDMKYIKVNEQWKIKFLKHTRTHYPPGGRPPFEGV